MVAPPEETVPAPERHSGFGAASFVLSAVAGLAMFVLLLIATVLEATTPGGIDKQSAGNILLGLSIIALLGIDVIAIGLGIAGILQRERKKLFAILGTIFAFATVAGTIFLIVVGLTFGRTSKAAVASAHYAVNGKRLPYSLQLPATWSFKYFDQGPVDLRASFMAKGMFVDVLGVPGNPVGSPEQWIRSGKWSGDPTAPT